MKDPRKKEAEGRSVLRPILSVCAATVSLLIPGSVLADGADTEIRPSALRSEIEGATTSYGDHQQCLTFQNKLKAVGVSSLMVPQFTSDQYDPIRFSKYFGRCKKINLSLGDNQIGFQEPHADFRLYAGNFYGFNDLGILFARKYMSSEDWSELSHPNRSVDPRHIGLSFDGYSTISFKYCSSSQLIEVGQPGKSNISDDLTSIYTIDHIYYIVDYQNQNHIISIFKINRPINSVFTVDPVCVYSKEGGSK